MKDFLDNLFKSIKEIKTNHYDSEITIFINPITLIKITDEYCVLSNNLLSFNERPHKLWGFELYVNEEIEEDKFELRYSNR